MSGLMFENLLSCSILASHIYFSLRGAVRSYSLSVRDGSGFPAVIAVAAMTMEDEHRLDDRGLQLTKIINSGIPDRVRGIAQKSICKRIVDFTEDELFLRNNWLAVIHGYS